MIDADEQIDEATETVMKAIKVAAENHEIVLSNLKANPQAIESSWRSFFEELFENVREIK